MISKIALEREMAGAHPFLPGEIEVWRDPAGTICLRSQNAYNDPSELGDEGIIYLAEILILLASQQGGVDLSPVSEYRESTTTAGKPWWIFQAANGVVDVWFDGTICLNIRKPRGEHIELSNSEARALVGMLMHAVEVDRG